MKNKNAFDWDIEKRKIIDSNGNVIQGYNEIYRRGFTDSSNDGTIAVMKKSYNPITTDEFTEIVEGIARSLGADSVGYTDWNSWGRGRKVITSQILLSDALNIAGSKVQGYLTIGTGFDGNRSFYVGHTNEYLRCTNQWGSIITDFTARLTKNVLHKVDEVVGSIELYTEYERRLYNNFKRLQEVKIDDGIIQECVARIVGLTKEERELTLQDRLEVFSTQKLNKIDAVTTSILSEVGELGNNAWGMFNGVTHYTTHVMNSRTEEPFGNLFGAKSLANKKAYEFSLELM